MVKLADTQKEKEHKKIQQLNTNILGNLGTMGGGGGGGGYNQAPQYMQVISLWSKILG